MNNFCNGRARLSPNGSASLLAATASSTQAKSAHPHATSPRLSCWWTAMTDALGVAPTTMPRSKAVFRALKALIVQTLSRGQFREAAPPSIPTLATALALPGAVAPLCRVGGVEAIKEKYFAWTGSDATTAVERKSISKMESMCQEGLPVMHSL